MNRPDASIHHHGSVAVVELNSEAARTWVGQHVQVQQAWGPSGIVVEPRYLGPIVDGMRDDGLVVA